jgi:hypothetical protein
LKRFLIQKTKSILYIDEKMVDVMMSCTMNKKQVLGISGNATSGKDTFANILTNRLKAANKTVDRFAFADALKQDCDEFCKTKLGISAFTQVPAEKLLIRPLLVWYGDAKRKQSNGRYWVDIIDQKVKASTADFCLVTDVRYDFYPTDEIDWVKKECNGLVVHVSRWSWKTEEDPHKGFRDYKEYIPPANDHERENNPKIIRKADYCVSWENVTGMTMEQLTHAPSLVAHVDAFIKQYSLI